MALSRRSGLSIFAALVLAACGARTALLERGSADTSPGTSDGAGGAPVTTTTAATGGAGGAPPIVTGDASASTTSSVTPTGSTGVGGAPSVCGALGVADSVVLEDDDIDARAPWLVPIGAAGESVALVHSGSSVSKATGARIRLRMFDPWSAWPPSIPAAAYLQTKGAFFPAASFAVASRKPSAAPGFALAYRDYAGSWFNIALNPLAKTATWFTDIAKGDLAAFFAPSADGTQFFTLFRQSGNGHFGVSPNLSNANHSMNLFSVACATTPIVADAVAGGPGWIMALASGVTPKWDSADYPCEQKFDDVGPASTIYPGVVDLEGYPFTPAEPIDLGEPALRIRMAPRSDGAWLAYGTASTPIRVARLDPAGHVALAPVTPPDGAGAPAASSLAAASLDDDLVLASVDTAPGAAAQIVVRRFDANGVVTAALPIALGGAIDGEPSLVAAPGRGVLVAWSELPAGADGHQLRIARLDCLGVP
jgi:hypothetical protein